MGLCYHSQTWPGSYSPKRGCEARITQSKAPFPDKEARGLATIIKKAGRELGICFERKRDFVTREGRFAVELAPAGLKWIDPSSGRLATLNNPPREANSAMLRMIPSSTEWKPGAAGKLECHSKLLVPALNGVGKPTAADLNTLGIPRMPDSEVSQAVVSACARLVNSGAIQTSQGRSGHAILASAMQGFDQRLKAKIDAMVQKNLNQALVAATGSFNGHKLQPVKGMSLSQKGKSFIKSQEGFDPNLYDLDGAKGKNCTIAYGHLVHAGACDGIHAAEQPFLNGITQQQADAFFSRDVALAENDVKGIVGGAILVTQPMFDAFVSLLFNIGRSKADPKWNLFEETRKGNFAAAANEFLNIDKVTVVNKTTGKSSLQSVKGLTARRRRERELYLNGKY